MLADLSGAFAKLLRYLARQRAQGGARRGGAVYGPTGRVLVLVPVRGGAPDSLFNLGPGLEAAALERQRAQDLWVTTRSVQNRTLRSLSDHPCLLEPF